VGGRDAPTGAEAARAGQARTGSGRGPIDSRTPIRSALSLSNGTSPEPSTSLVRGLGFSFSGERTRLAFTNFADRMSIQRATNEQSLRSQHIPVSLIKAAQAAALKSFQLTANTTSISESRADSLFLADSAAYCSPRCSSQIGSTSRHHS
jgi:hypothetical protein